MNLATHCRESRDKTWRRLLVLLALAFLITTLAPTVSAEDFPVTTIFLVRHAEKAAQPAGDPPLTPAGNKRARALLDVVRASDVTTIFATNRIRTQQTVEPAAKALGLDPKILDIRDVDGLVAKILADHRGETILVAGHSGTVPRIIDKLGGGKIPALAETHYDNLFVVTVYANGKAKAVRLKYGNPT